MPKVYTQIWQSAIRVFSFFYHLIQGVACKRMAQWMDTWASAMSIGRSKADPCLRKDVFSECCCYAVVASPAPWRRFKKYIARLWFFPIIIYEPFAKGSLEWNQSDTFPFPLLTMIMLSVKSMSLILSSNASPSLSPVQYSSLISVW